MNTIIRGTLDQFIDSILEGGVIEDSLTMFEGLAPAVKNIEDAIFGYVIGRIVQFIDTTIQSIYQRLPNNEEGIEIAKILKNRTVEIKSKITLVANR
jgi:hypothetical protein